jgi:hypothetical protein
VGPVFATLPYALAAIVAILTTACGGSQASPGAPTQSLNPSLRGEVTDPSGDALADARIASSPDLVRASLDAWTRSITVAVRVSAGTFASQTTRFIVLLNTDQNPTTGTGPLGIEYFVRMGGILGNRVDIVGSDGDVVVGSVTASFVANGIDAVVPLTLFGNDDGRLDFKVFASAGPVWPDILDRMPDEGLPPGRVQ